MNTSKDVPPPLDRSIIERYAHGATVPADSIKGLTAKDLDAFPIPGTWSIRQIVVHLMDSDLIASDRFKRIAAMDVPLIMNYDESAFVRVLHPERLDPAMCCEVFRLNRVLTAEVLRSLSDAAFERYGIHSQSGKRTLADLVKGYCEHLDGHVAWIQRKRKMLGK